MPKRIVFLTGTRADFGKIKSLIEVTQNDKNFDVHIFATGMHMNSKYGKTVNEIYKSGFTNIYQFINHDEINHMDRTLAKTIDGFSTYIAEIQPELIIIHGDRIEALAGAIVASLNNILAAHIEGGEVSGTVDDSIRHAISKLSHLHLVGNEQAGQRLVQLGENKENIFLIGSPDLDLMNPDTLPSLEFVKNYYEIPFKNYALVMFHPVTTEFDAMQTYAQNLVKALEDSDRNYIVILPNNDLGSHEIMHEYKKLSANPKFKIFPSIRFEYFLQLLRNADFLIGNSSTAMHEAPYYHIPAINIGSRQKNRSKSKNIINTGYAYKEILQAIESVKHFCFQKEQFAFGKGNSNQLFLRLLQQESFWKTPKQKQFYDLESK
ncbi:UDP-N-acetylglucosamine 2-epimerase [Sulfurimonas sp. NW7]|uniref:UDP-N-acetylglucosamine 2-epimerase n=1 Tax=Sulfurimonas sp. NW7 TaxID=2922727 RepID=UPI003DA8FFCA